jgi:exodeoxyribonuclease VII small subunit
VKKNEEPTFDEARAGLEEIVERLDKGEPALEESLKLYEEAIRLSRLCHRKLEEAQGRIEQLNKDDRGQPALEKPTFEEARAGLEDIVERLDKGEPTLEESLKLYEEAIRLSRFCHRKLEEAQGKIELLNKDDRGELVLDTQGRPKTKPLPPPEEDD